MPSVCSVKSHLLIYTHFKSEEPDYVAHVTRYTLV